LNPKADHLAKEMAREGHHLVGSTGLTIAITFR
jgi:hypothetical protein